MQLPIEFILMNNYLLADLIEDKDFSEMVISQLELSDLKKLYEHLTNQENVDRLKRLFIDEYYENYYATKVNVAKFTKVKELGVELIPNAGLALLFLSFLKDLKDVVDSKRKIDAFIIFIKETYLACLQSSMDEVIRKRIQQVNDEEIKKEMEAFLKRKN